MNKVFFGLLLLAACGTAQTVEGTIVNSVTGTGIAGVRVFLMPVSGQADYSATTDALGHFLLKGVETGTYQFGYVSPGYLSSDPMPPRRQVEIGGGGTPVKLEGRMTALPRVSGRIVDGDGEGIANALLEIIGRKDPPVSSDAAGKFELRLNPGAYILSVLPPTGLKPPEPDGERTLVWTRTFYPDVAYLEAASQVVLRPGSELSGIVIKLQAVPSHAVRGVLLNPDGTPVPRATITVGAEQDPASGRPMFRRDPARTLRTQTNSEGAFEFPQVAEGEWCLSGEVESGGEKRRATQWIDIAGRELEGVKLRLVAPFTLRGKVVIDTPGPDPFPVLFLPHGRPIRNDTGMSNWMLFPELYFEQPIPRNVPDAAEALKATQDIITNELSDELGAIIATPNANGDFRLQNVYPDSYRIVSMPPPPPYYMAAVRVGETILTTAATDLSSGAAPITIVYRTDGGVIRGTAEKCAGGLVLLIPQDPAIQSLGFLRSVRCDAGDRYEITAVRPGDYYVLAFAEPGGVPQLSDILISQAGKVTVHANETTSADLRAIQRPGGS